MKRMLFVLEIVVCIVSTFTLFNSFACTESGRTNYQASNLLGYYSEGEIDYKALGKLDGEKLIINVDVDLEGKTCRLPKDIILCSQGGILTNGEIVGENATIQNCRPLFSKIKIRGSWLVPTIKTSMFVNSEEVNNLKNIFALTNPRIKNKVVIENGEYSVAASYSGDACLTINSNTEVILKGKISLKPNAFESYDVVRIEGENVSLKGNGCLIGDKSNHKGTSGEWGMGLHIHNSRNVSVSGIEIRDCWGDCIYIGGSSKKVKIEQCKLLDGRRQGVSITNARDVEVRKCYISNIGGTDPEYGIDVEPNKGDICDNILIEKVIMFNCKGGFSVYGKAQEAYVGSVIIRNSKICGDGKSAVCIIDCDKATIDNCKLSQKDFWKVFDCRGIRVLRIGNNTIKRFELAVYKLRALGRKMRIKGGLTGPIYVANCGKVYEQNNFDLSDK